MKANSGIPRTARPAPKDDATSARMRLVRRSGTAPELALRRALHAAGFRYRVDCEVIPSVRSRADIVFRRARVAIYVDGCFWHGCPRHATSPMSNSTWWKDKLAANVARDLSVTKALIRAGWVVLRFWEHEDIGKIVKSVSRTVSTRSGF